MCERNEGGAWKVPPPQLYFNPFQIHSWLTLLVLGPIFVDGCIRRTLFQPHTTTTTTTTTASTTTTTTTTTGTTTSTAGAPGAPTTTMMTLRPMTLPAMEETTVPTLPPSHKQACLPEEVHSTNCLHGGTCYVVVLNENRQSFCHCTEEWTGKRCEQYFIDPGILASMEQNMRTANIAAGVSVCILVLFVLLFASYVYLRKKRRRKLFESPPTDADVDAEALTSLEPNGRQLSQDADEPNAAAAEFDLNGNDRLPREETRPPRTATKSTAL